MKDTNAAYFSILVLVACNSDVIGDLPEPLVPQGCAGIPSESDSAGPGEYEFEGGRVYECSGTRKARIDARVCTDPACLAPQLVHEYVPPFESEPIVSEELLTVEQDFAPSDGNPPPTAACCTETTPQASVLATGLVDCAARSCLEVHDQIVVLKHIMQAEFDSLAGGVKKNALGRALESLVFYAQHLEMPSGFKACTNALHLGGGYTLPNPDPTGIGSLQDVEISGFECLMLECVTSEADEPTTGGGGDTCTQNPNWFEGNAAQAALGAGVPQSGTLTIELGGGETQPAFHGIGVAYERLARCAGRVCPFALTDLRFTLEDIGFGPLTLHAPSVSLDRLAFGAETGGRIALDSGALVLRVEGSLSLAGQPFLDGAVIPLFVANTGPAELRLKGQSLSLEHASFELLGARAQLAIAATGCHEW